MRTVRVRCKLQNQIIAVEDDQHECGHYHNQRLETKIRIDMQSQFVENLLDVHRSFDNIQCGVGRVNVRCVSCPVVTLILSTGHKLRAGLDVPLLFGWMKVVQIVSIALNGDFYLIGGTSWHLACLNKCHCISYKCWYAGMTFTLCVRDIR